MIAGLSLQCALQCDEQSPVFLAHCERAYGLVRRRSERLAGLQAEACPMPGADNLAAIANHLSAGERLAVMGAAVLDREEPLGAARDDDGHAIDLDRHGQLGIDIGGGADVLPRRRHQNIPVCSRAASDIID